MADKSFTSKVTASNTGIKNLINKNILSSLQAINEYIWNSIDAHADEIKVNLQCQGKTPKKLIIEDNGEGINFDKLNVDLFGHTNDSWKRKLKKPYLSLPHGENGFGRFSFVKFANKATWKSVYKNGEDFREFETYIQHPNLIKFEGIKSSKSKREKTGTTLIITNFSVDQDLVEDEKKSMQKIKNSLLKEFYWVIGLKNLKLSFNGEILNIGEISEKYSKNIKIDEESFKIELLRWNESYGNESNLHYLNSKEKEIYFRKSPHTKLDKKFHHSIFIKSKLFDRFSPASEIARGTNKQEPITDKKETEIFEKLRDKVNKFTDSVRKKFSGDFVEERIKTFEKNKYFDKIISNVKERDYKKPQIIEVTKEILRFAPSVFSELNKEQTLVFLNLINKTLYSDSQNLLEILKILIKPENESSLEGLRKILEKYPLENIVSTIKLIEDRLLTLKKIEELVYNEAHYIVESDLQKVIEEHFWIFGEEFSEVIGAEEDDFNKLFKEYCKLHDITQESGSKKLSKKQVDLFICGQSRDGSLEKNLIIEIKRPKRNKDSKSFMEIGLKENNQLEEYSEIIRNIPLFNSPATKMWNYILIGAGLDDSFSYEDRSKSLMKSKKRTQYLPLCR